MWRQGWALSDLNRRRKGNRGLDSQNGWLASGGKDEYDYE